MFRFAFIFFVALLVFSSCERISNTATSKLVFSSDTVFFDTIFTSVGSVTKELRVKNPENKVLVINQILLAGGQSSQFRLNIDGEPVNEKSNVRIDPGDSIFIFIDANINPSDNNSPIEVSDSIIFLVKEKSPSVKLLAWGQDINLLKNKVIENEDWVKGKPYVIYNQAIVDTLATLNISEGTKVYFHRNAVLKVAGTLIVDGTLTSPVLFAADRLEKMYQDIPGQWIGILFLNPSRGNNIRNAIIRNSVYGLQLGESKSDNSFPGIKLNSTIIAHSSVCGLSSINGKIEAANCEIYHCGNYCLYIAGGGEYSFTYCSMFNRWDYGFRQTPALYISEKPVSFPLQMNLHVFNSILSGDNVTEIGIVPSGSVQTGNYILDHCLVKLDTLHSSFWNRNVFTGTIVNKDPLFIDLSKWDLRPDTLSPLINNGNPVYSASYPFDIRGVSRIVNGNPDIGAFERLPGEHKKDK